MDSNPDTASPQQPTALPIHIQSLTKKYGKFFALDAVDLDIKSGEFLTLLGPSGSGKTTLLMAIAGFNRPDAGSIRFGGDEMILTPPHKRNVGMVFQSYALFPHMSVAENVGFPLKLRGIGTEESAERVAAALTTVQLASLGDRGIEELSGGQRQRVALARAFVFRPRILLMDEPLSALDKKLREQMQLELRDLQRSVGITFVFVTHDQEEALTMSDRIAVMSKGRVLQVASPTGLYEQPNSQFVANFIGNMNFFNGRVEESDNGTAVIDAGPLGAIETELDDESPGVGADVVVAIRPEKLKLHFEAPGEGANIVEGRIGPVAYLGERSHFHVLLPGSEQPVAVAVQNMERSVEGLAATDQPIWLSFSSESVVLLRPD